MLKSNSYQEECCEYEIKEGAETREVKMCAFSKVSGRILSDSEIDQAKNDCKFSMLSHPSIDKISWKNIDERFCKKFL